ncbi:MAG: exodeoxyribonuclease III [Balneolales bacterium]
MKIITVNVNGIRSAYQKGFFKWLLQQQADVVCLQETKAQIHQLVEDILSPPGYFSYFNDAEKKGYSGVAIYSRKQPDKVFNELGWDHADTEGRYLQADFGKLSVVSLYLPSGSSGEERQQIKFDFMDRFMPRLEAMRRKRREYILCGDWNIAHKEIDLKNWRGNRKNSGFLPEEREWMDKLFGETGFVDAFRVVNQEADQYTWWSNRGQARAKNVGWRIDYQIVSPGLKDRVKSVSIYKDEWFSDHAPLIMEYDLPDC